MDKFILNILKKIEKNGFSAYVVGGYVRDYLLGIESRDIDICTNALPKDIVNIFKLKKDSKDNYGSVNIKTKKYNIDITTFRSESGYNNHKPLNVEYVNILELDLKRRDFSINSILMNSEGEVIDTFNGIEDLNNKVIRCIGDTDKKLSEDPLRILRAIRLSIIYELELDKEILEFIKNNKELIKGISFYRRKEELDKIFSSKNKIKGLKLLKILDLLDVLELSYEEVKYTNDLCGIYAQMEYSKEYPMTKEMKNIVKDIREVQSIGEINNYTLYKYGLYINIIAGEIFGLNNIEINKMYKSLPIKSKKDIKITVKSIVKLNNNCYNNINEIINSIEKNILNGSLKNNSRDIIKFIRK